MVAHTSQHLYHGGQEAYVKHGLGQLDMAEVAWGVLNITPIRRAYDATVHGSKPWITESVELWAAIVISLTNFDFDHRVLPLQHPAY